MEWHPVAWVVSGWYEVIFRDDYPPGRLLPG